MTEIKFASRWERIYYNLLQAKTASGEISSFSYEPVTFKLAPRTTYTPDFLLVMPDGTIQIHEVKGFAREDAIVKFKVAAAMNTWAVFVMVRKVKDSWKELFRFNDGVTSKLIPITEALNAPVTLNEPKQIAKPAYKMTYQAMLLSAPHAAVLKMANGDFVALRKRLGKSPSDMSMLIGLPHLDSWEKLEIGAQKLYHQRHVEAIMRIK